ncbi:DUF1570 domain-containing protein [Brevundimonas sp. FT23028]|uniref:DUF1570 domain-containing protein n=1 Tax=Brevundimonas sp. FT23028 TaxID=3393748 RepID=UPI003B5892D8
MTARLFRTVLTMLAALTAFVAAPAQAQWLRAETAHFVVYGAVSESQIRAYAKKAERFDALLRRYYPIEVDHEIPKLDIFLADGRRDMLLASPGISAGVGGYYSPNSGRIHAVVDLDAMSGDVVLFHEYAHHFMFQMRSNAYPSWFVEGFAEYYSTADIRDDRYQFGRHNPGRMNSLTRGANTWAPMEDLLTWRYTASGRFPGHQYYAQAWAMTHYFMSTPERTQMLGRYLNLVVNGQDSVSAMQQATGRTAGQLQDDLRRYLLGQINVLTPAIDMPDPEVAVTRLSAAESALAWLNMRLDATAVKEPARDTPQDETAQQRQRRERAERDAAETRAALIRETLAVAARYPDERIAILATAKAHRLALDPVAAMAALQPLLNDNETDGEMLRIAGFATLDQVASADPEAAVRLRRRASGYFARAMDSEPLDFRIYLGLNDTRAGQAQYPTDNDLATLEVAVTLAPQSFDARMRLGEAYLSRGMPDAAVLTVQPVANSPHRSSYVRRARNLIAAARNQTPDEAAVEAEDEEEEEGAPDAA